MSAYTLIIDSKYTYRELLDVLVPNESVFKNMVEAMTRNFGLPNFVFRKTRIVDKNTPHQNKIYM